MMGKFKHIFFTGIGGISMSGLAELMLHNNIRVSGSDSSESMLVTKLRKDGAKIYIGHAGENVDETVDVLVYTSAVKDDNDELLRAKELGIKIKSRAEFLGEIMKEHDSSIAVAGTHGKTTTTGMLSSILVNSELDPTIFLGGELDIIDGNIRIGKNKLLLTEACEYKRNFLSFCPTIAIVLNIDEDHLDYYKDLKEIESAFSDFGNILPENGLLVVNVKNKDQFVNAKCKVIDFGINEKSDIRALNLKYTPNPIFDVEFKGENLGNFELSVFGEHNVLNALSSIAVAIELGIELQVIKNGLKSFKGTKRRYEFKGKFDGVTVIDDYAHHPTEIEATLKTAREITEGKVVTVFQPHTFTRTKSLLQEFAQSFQYTDEIIITDIYAARELDNGEIHSKDLVEATRRFNDKVLYAENLIEAARLARELARKNDIVLTMGAGNIDEVAKLLLS